jgi:hypothetical protein
MQKTQKEGSYGQKNSVFPVAACAYVRARAQNCLFWASCEEKITQMTEYVGKIYINETAKITFEQGRTLPL